MKQSTEPVAPLDSVRLACRPLGELRAAGVRMVLANVNASVAAQLERYGLVAALGPDACFDTAGEVLEAYLKTTGGGATHPEDGST